MIEVPMIEVRTRFIGPASDWSGWTEYPSAEKVREAVLTNPMAAWFQARHRFGMITGRTVPPPQPPEDWTSEKAVDEALATLMGYYQDGLKE